MDPTQQAVADALAELCGSGDFAVKRTMKARSLALEVRGVGPIAFPISKAMARQLCASALLAKYGQRDRTLLDTKVRSCWEIEKRRLVLDRRAWTSALAPELEHLKEQLGLPLGLKLRAELHNLLVYAPGQFFVTHQDSEKGDDMIGTLVVTLPSVFQGGAIVVRHAGEARTFRGSGKELGLIAFYADCEHEVRRVTSGYRVALTFNLHASDGERACAPPIAPGARHALARSIRRFFETASPPRWSGDGQREPPDRLVYLLDHEYSQRGLSWGRLKRTDALRAAALREVALELDCEVCLALADVHENWSCEDPEDTYWRHRGRRAWQDEDDDDDDALTGSVDEHPPLLHLNDSRVELRHWIGTDGDPQAASSSADDAEISFTTPSEALKPFRSAHEGYMGNWGNTVDRWYHRAAVVLWPRERTFVIRAKASAVWAIDAIGAELEAERIEAARSMTQRMASFWPQLARNDTKARFFGKTLRVASALDHRDLAHALLAPFLMERLEPKTAPALAGLLAQYGLAWGKRLSEAWVAPERHRPYDSLDRREAWLASLPSALEALLAPRRGTSRTENRAAAAFARALLRSQWDFVAASYDVARQQGPTYGARLRARLEAPLLGVLESAVLCGEAALVKQITTYLTSGAVPVLASIELLRRAEQRRPQDDALNRALAPVRAHCVAELEALAGVAPRAHDDWSIVPPGDCRCPLCDTLWSFLRASDQTRFDWPLAKNGRAHVHRVVTRHELPVTHVTHRKGSPYTLVLQKTRALFDREAKDRTARQHALDWLRGKPRKVRPRATRPR